ncbi:hypothetical protein ACFV0L_10590 [Streptosporangium canum]|uniref:hypothetical protein n=1 Tax=Streptosporangium canum TaxID=324952 RepID=UPI00367E7641
MKDYVAEAASLTNRAVNLLWELGVPHDDAVRLAPTVLTMARTLEERDALDRIVENLL